MPSIQLTSVKSEESSAGFDFPRARKGAGTSRTLFLMVATALVIRLATMCFLYPEQLDARQDHFRFGFETGRIARSIATGKGFASPLYDDTGPSAWMTPVYPYIVALFFKGFGVYTKAAALAILTFNAMTSAITCIPIFFFSRKTFGEQVGRWAGWAWAFFPYGIYFPVERIWETWLATLLLCFLFQIVLNLENTNNLLAWIGTGLLWGATGLTSAVVLAVMPFLHAWVAYRRHLKNSEWASRTALCVFAMLGVLLPWTLRNYRVFHRIIPLRDNAGIVLRLGTKGNSDYWGPYELGPWHNDVEWREFKEHGEIQYMDHKREQAVSFIRSQPGWYAWTSIRRAVFIWTGYWSFDPTYLRQEEWDPYNIPFCSGLTLLAGLGLYLGFRRRIPQIVPYMITIVIFPCIYYITSPEFYYRRPIDPLLLTLAVSAVVPRLTAWRKTKVQADVGVLELEFLSKDADLEITD
jgi:hypothetical protein